MTNKNVLLLGLSTFNRCGEAVTNHYRYTYENSTIDVCGSQTYEPVAMMLIKLLQSKGQQLDTVVMLCTEDALRYAAKDFKNKLGDGVEYITVPVKNIMNTEDEVFHACTMAVDSIPDGASVYLDVTGGFRDSAMLLTSAMQLIKGRPLSLEGVFYVNYFVGSTPENPCPILNRNSAYGVFDLISGLNELTKTGGVTTLCEYFKDKKLTEREKNILKCLANVSREVRLCRIDQSLIALSELRFLLQDYDRPRIKHTKLFISVAERARRKYEMLLAKDNVTFADFVEWSVKNKDYSQALSYYYEKIPEYFVETGLIYPSDRMRRELMEGTADKPLLGNERVWQQRFLAPHKQQKKEKAAIRLSDYYNKSFSNNADAIKAADIPEEIKQYFLECLNMRQVIAGEGGSLKKARRFWDKANLGSLSDSTERVEDCTKASPQFNLYNRTACLNEYLGIETKPAATAEHVPTAEGMADQMIDRIDNENVFSRNPQLARALLADYYYFTRQRHNVLHVTGQGDAPAAVIKRLEKSVRLLRKLN